MLTKEKLRNTYIEYSKDITEEVFNRIVDKLINEFGYSWYDEDTSYKDFIKLKCLKIDPYRTNQIRMCDPSNEKLITVRDILGEDWDKSKFEVGKCYYANWNWSNIGKIVFKVTKNIDPDSVNFSGFYNLKRKFWVDGTSIRLKELSDIQEISLEEIQQYLPADHVDKIKKSKQENMDKVAVSLPTQEKWDFFLSKFNPRKLSKDLWKKEHFVVIKHSDKGYVGTHTDDKDWLTRNNYKIITFEEWLKDNNYTFPEHKDFQAIEIPEFKVGDKVEIIDSGNSYSIYNTAFKAIGFKNTIVNECTNKDAGTIFHICKHPGYNINLISINLDNGEQCLIGMKGIKKISEYIPKIGDYIRYLGTKCGKIDEDWEEYFGQYGIKKYDVGIIRSAYLDGSCFIKEDGRPTDDGYLTKEDFTVITKEEYLRDRPFNGNARKLPEIGDVRGSEGLFTQEQQKQILAKLDECISLTSIDNSILPSPAIKEVKQPNKTFEFNKQINSYKFINKKSYVKKEFKFS